LGQSFSLPTPNEAAHLKDPENEAHLERHYFDFLHAAAARYQTSEYDGVPVVLFRGKQRTYGFASIADLGWNGLLGEKFEVCEVDGNHFTMFIPPYSEGLATRMREYIRRSQLSENS